jgi:hypothetical protein
MIFSNHSTLTDTSRLARRVALAWVLSTPLISVAAFDTPQRPANAMAGGTSPAVVPERLAKARAARNPRPYLAMVGPSAIKFAGADPVLPTEPSLPPQQKPKLPLPPESQPKTPAVTGDPTPAVPTGTSTETPPEANANGSKPVSILPDDTRREIRPEDVLPFFQFPNASDNGTVALPLIVTQPASNPVPPSTATYRQQ